MKPEDLADTIHVVRSGTQSNSIELSIRDDQNYMLVGLPIPPIDALKWENVVRDYVRYLIGKAITMDRESRRQAEDPTTVSPGQ